MFWHFVWQQLSSEIRPGSVIFDKIFEAYLLDVEATKFRILRNFLGKILELLLSNIVKVKVKEALLDNIYVKRN